MNNYDSLIGAKKRRVTPGDIAAVSRLHGMSNDKAAAKYEEMKEHLTEATREYIENQLLGNQ